MAPGIYKVITTNKQETKSVLTSTGLKDATSVRRPSSRGSSSKNSVLSDIKNHSEDVEVHVRTNKKTNITSKKNVVQTKKIVTNVAVKNALKAKDVLCVSCDKDVLTPCHDKCPEKYKLFVHSKVRRALFTTPKIAKSKPLDTTPVVTKTRFAVTTLLSAKNMVSSASRSTSLLVQEKSLSKYTRTKINTGGLGHNLFSVGQFCDGDLEVAFLSKTCYVCNLEGDDLLTGARESNLYTISISDMTTSSPVCIMQQFSITRTPQQNGVVKGRNRTLVEAARTMLIFSKSLEFLWAEAISIACFTQNHSLIHTRYNKTPYELLRDRKPNVEYFHVFGSLCYPTNDREDLGKMKPKADIEEQISPISTADAAESVDEDSTNFDGNTLIAPYDSLTFEEAETSSIAADPSNMHEFNQVQPSTHTWTKAHPLEQVIGDPSKPVMMRSRLHTDAEVYMYALTVSTTEHKNIKEAR
ncbi:retrovirus-related pol polyprotein from transposon TNT 1-94 [Tanacetum coccineum]